MSNSFNKYFFGFLFIFGNLYGLMAQGNTKSPVQWDVKSKKLADGKVEVTATATMPLLWNIYSQFTDDNGPIPTSFEIDGKEVKFVEKSKVIKVYDEMFEVNVHKFKETAVFTYVSTADVIGKTTSITFMSCDGARCLPPVTLDFVISLL